MSSVNLDMAGRTALVTGASRGIGAAVAHRLSAAGAHLVLAARDATALDALARDLPGETTVFAADLSRPDVPLELLKAATEVTGHLDVLVNNAGISGNVPSDQLTPEMLDELLAVNVRSVLLLAGHGAARMAAAGGGSIVNVSSSVANSGVPWASAYSATKGALDAMTRSLAAEWGAQGVRVNAVRPGITRTDMTGQLLSMPGFNDFYDTQTPIGRIGEPEEVAALVAFLASDLSAHHRPGDHHRRRLGRLAAAAAPAAGGRGRSHGMTASSERPAELARWRSDAGRSRRPSFVHTSHRGGHRGRRTTP